VNWITDHVRFLLQIFQDRPLTVPLFYWISVWNSWHFSLWVIVSRVTVTSFLLSFRFAIQVHFYPRS
jgi:hypothetical protein